MAAFDASLGKLGFDYLDLYIIHWPGGGPDKRKDSWRAMEELLESKRVRAIGVSNYLEQHIAEIIEDPALKHNPHINQCELHPECQWADLRGFCAANGVQFMGYMPFGGQGAPLLREGAIKAAAEAASASSGRAVTPAQLLVKFVRHSGAVAIPRSTDAGRQIENVALDGLELSPEVMETLAGMEADEHYDWDPNGVP